LPCYLLVLLSLHARSETPAAKTLLLPFWGLALLDFAASFVLPPWVEKGMATRLDTRTSRQPPPSEDDLKAALYRSVVVQVTITAACADCIAVYGFVLGLAGAPLRTWLPFFLLAFLLLVWQKTQHPSYFQLADEKAREIYAGYIGSQS
jgi:hypothetical protein